LAGSTFGVTEPAVVEDQHVGPGRGERLGEAEQAGVARPAEAVRHHHARPAFGPGQSIAPRGDVPGGAPDTMAGEMKVLHVQTLQLRR